MELEYVREFITLAQTENYMAAAEELYISQPSLSKHIKALETELGVPLFDRTTRRVRLNRFGTVFLPFARRMVEAGDAFRTELSSLIRDADGVVHLGVLPSFLAYGIQEHLSAFRRQHPDYLVTMIEGTNPGLLHSLEEGECSVAFVRHTGEHLGSQFAAIPYRRDKMVLVIPENHPLDDGRASVHAPELESLELMTSNSSTMGELLDEFTGKTGAKLHITAHLARSESIITMVQEHFGAALLMQTPTVLRHAEGIRILPVEPEVSNMVYLVYLKDKPLGRATRAFIRTVFPEGTKGV